VSAAGGGWKLPPGYLLVRSPTGRWAARAEAAEELASGGADRLLSGPAVLRKGAGTGRGETVRMRLGGMDAIGKRAVHGGVLGPILRGLYLGPGRVFDQIRSADRLTRSGVSTAPILAAGWRRALGVFTAQAVVGRAVPGGRNLHQAAREERSPLRRRRILEAAAATVRAMHDAGFRHADLNLTNLVLAGSGGAPSVVVIDLDRGRWLPMGPAERAGNLLRLARSCDRWLPGPEGPSRRERARFLAAYWRGDRVLRSALRARLGRSQGRASG
jgi:hypothetical protein